MNASHGAIVACTVEDRPALFDLYRASCPEVPVAAIASDVNEQSIRFWYACKSESGEIRVAMFVWASGVVFVLVRPEDVESEEVAAAFLNLAREIRRRLAPSGVTELSILHSTRIQRFGELLERAGFLSKELVVARTMHFSAAGEVERKN